MTQDRLENQIRKDLGFRLIDLRSREVRASSSEHQLIHLFSLTNICELTDADCRALSTPKADVAARQV